MSLLLIQPITLNAAETISLKCELDTYGIHRYKRSEIYKENYKKSLAEFDKKTAERMALALRAKGFEFTLKGIEIDKDIDEVTDLNDLGFLGQSFTWYPDQLQYSEFFGWDFYIAHINRETLNYTVSLTNFPKKIMGNDSFSGQCEILKLKPKF